MKINKLVVAPLSLAGMSVGMGMLGESLGSEGLKEGGQAAGKFISPAVTIMASGLVVNQLKEIKKDIKENKESKKSFKGLIY